MATIADRLNEHLKQDDGFTLAITLITGQQLDLGLYEAVADGVIVETERGSGLRRFIPLTAIAFIDLEP